MGVGLRPVARHVEGEGLRRARVGRGRFDLDESRIKFGVICGGVFLDRLRPRENDSVEGAATDRLPRPELVPEVYGRVLLEDPFAVAGEACDRSQDVAVRDDKVLLNQKTRAVEPLREGREANPRDARV